MGGDLFIKVKKGDVQFLTDHPAPVRFAGTHESDEEDFHNVQMCIFANVQIRPLMN